MADLFSRELLAQGFSPKRIADGRRLQQEENALARILNQQSIDQNEAILRGTRLENKARARSLSAPSPKPKLSALQQKIEIIGGKPFDELSPEERKAAYLSIPSNPGVVVNTGDMQKPTGSVESQLQKDILKGEQDLRDLQQVASTHSDEFLTAEGNMKSFLGKWADKLGQQNDFVTFNANRTRFRNAANQYFNAYRKNITGAAASEEEMKRLLDSMFNENQGPTEFKASFDLFMEKAQANLEANKAAARGGINVSETPTEESKPRRKFNPATGTFE